MEGACDRSQLRDGLEIGTRLTRFLSDIFFLSGEINSCLQPKLAVRAD